MLLKFTFAVLLVTVCARPDIKDADKSHMNPDEAGPYFQGDMILTPGQKNGLMSPDQHWADGIIYYSFDDEFVNVENRAVVMQAQADYVALTDGCMTFVERTTEKGYIHYTSVEGIGCFSYVGYTGFGQQMNLPQWCIDTYGSVLHEHLHAFGFFHEQSRFDRDDYVEIKFDLITPDAVGNFEKEEEDYAGAWGEDYDYLSVMHYSKSAFAINAGDITIVTLKLEYQDLIGQRAGLSESDENKLLNMYCAAKKDIAGRN